MPGPKSEFLLVLWNRICYPDDPEIELRYHREQVLINLGEDLVKLKEHREELRRVSNYYDSRLKAKATYEEQFKYAQTELAHYISEINQRRDNAKRRVGEVIENMKDPATGKTKSQVKAEISKINQELERLIDYKPTGTFLKVIAQVGTPLSVAVLKKRLEKAKQDLELIEQVEKALWEDFDPKPFEQECEEYKQRYAEVMAPIEKEYAALMSKRVHDLEQFQTLQEKLANCEKTIQECELRLTLQKSKLCASRAGDPVMEPLTKGLR